MGFLYRLVFGNNKSYIGITTSTPTVRFLKHQRNAAGRLEYPLYQAWRRHGAPRLEVLAIVEDRDLAQLEIRAIAGFGTLAPNGYNLALGGQLAPAASPAVAKKISDALKGRRPLCAELAWEANRGMPLSDEHRHKISIALKGRKQAPSVVAARAAKHRGHRHTEEAKARMGVANVGRKLAPEHIEKLRAANLGKGRSAETKAKISATKKARYAATLEERK